MPYRVTVGEEDFYLDLLFYHLKLRSFVVVELKVGAFKPDYAGKMNFYLNLVPPVVAEILVVLGYVRT